MPKDTIILDSTQVSSFQYCHQMWKLEHDEHLTLSNAKPNDAMTMGSFGHEMLELFYKYRAVGSDIGKSLEKALEFNPDQEFCKCGHGKKYHTIDEPPNPCTHCKCLNFEPTLYPLNEEQRTLVRERVRLCVYTYINDDFVPTSPDHVEVGFSHLLQETDDHIYILEGKMDMLMPHRGMKTWTDHKFQMSAHDLYTKDIQFRNYDLVARAPVACINYIRLTKKVDNTTFVRKWFGFSEVERQFWERQLIRIYDKVLKIKREGITPDDYEWGQCKGRFIGRTCAFTQLCEEAYLPQVVENRKKTLYHIKQEWKPW